MCWLFKVLNTITPFLLSDCNLYFVLLWLTEHTRKAYHTCLSTLWICSLIFSHCLACFYMAYLHLACHKVSKPFTTLILPCRKSVWGESNRSAWVTQWGDTGVFSGGNRAPYLPPAAGIGEPAAEGLDCGLVQFQPWANPWCRSAQRCFLLLRKPHDKELGSLCPYKFWFIAVQPVKLLQLLKCFWTTGTFCITFCLVYLLLVAFGGCCGFSRVWGAGGRMEELVV